MSCGQQLIFFMYSFNYCNHAMIIKCNVPALITWFIESHCSLKRLNVVDARKLFGCCLMCNIMKSFLLELNWIELFKPLKIMQKHSNRSRLFAGEISGGGGEHLMWKLPNKHCEDFQLKFEGGTHETKERNSIKQT